MAYNLRSKSKEPENPLLKDQSTPSPYQPVVDQTGFGFFSLLPQTPVVCLDFSSFLTSSPITSTIVAPTDTTHSVPHPLSSTFNTSTTPITTQPTTSALVKDKQLPSTSAAPSLKLPVPPPPPTTPTVDSQHLATSSVLLLNKPSSPILATSSVTTTQTPIKTTASPVVTSLTPFIPTTSPVVTSLTPLFPTPSPVVTSLTHFLPTASLCDVAHFSHFVSVYLI